MWLKTFQVVERVQNFKLRKCMTINNRPIAGKNFILAAWSQGLMRYCTIVAYTIGIYRLENGQMSWKVIEFCEKNFCFATESLLMLKCLCK